jgi:hypothetical protein
LRIGKIAGALARFVLAYGLLMAPWPGWVETYGKIYSSAAAFLFESTDPNRSVRIRHFVPRRGTTAETWSQDTSVSLQIRGPSVGFREVPPFSTGRSSRYTGYAPTALAIALVLATPVSWRRRGSALPWAVLLASGFSALMLAIWIHGWFYGQECISLAQFSAQYASRARMVASLLKMTGEMAPYYIAPVFIWTLVSLRRKDLESLFEKPAITHDPPA